jgi:hypothetical protein
MNTSRETDLLATEKLTNTTHSQVGLAVDVGRTGIQSVHVPPVPLTEAGLCDWIASALVGQSIQYHEGLLLLDRSAVASDLSTKDRTRVHSVARRAWIACELGLVHLFSMKVGDSHYRYIAIRSSSSLKPPEIRSRLDKANTADISRQPH